MTEIEFHRVLIVEDDADTRRNLCDLLELDGYRVDSVSSAAETLALPDLDQYTAIVLDRRLPDGSADELLPQIRDVSLNAAVVIVTGHADLGGTINALRDGVADFIMKPVNPDLLRASLNRLRQLREAETRALRAERLAAIGVVVAGVAHESRNAMQRIQARVDLMRLSLQNDQELMQDLDAIEQANLRLQMLYDELREFAAPIHLKRELCPLDEIIRHVWDHLSVHDNFLGAELDMQSSGCICNVDPMRMEQVFRNVMENGLSACPAPARISVNCSTVDFRGRPTARIVIADNGPGFGEDQRKQAFEPFFTTKCEGTGLGLAITRRIIDLHDGTIRILPRFETSSDAKHSPSETTTSIADFVDLPAAEDSGARILIQIPSAHHSAGECEGQTSDASVAIRGD